MGSRLAGKVAVVAGAGQTPGQTIGNGRASAIRYGAEGAKVVCVDLDEASAAETAAIIVHAGGEAIAIGADVTSEAACRDFIQAAVDTYGKLDILHNNVGIGGQDASPTRIEEEVWDRIMSTNLKGAIFAIKYALPIMRAQRSGVILNISSVAAVAVTPLTAYKASKAALNAYTHTVAMSSAKYGIRANVIMPGLMNTPIAIEAYAAAGMDRDEVIDSRDKAVPLAGGMGDGNDIAAAALFLVSDEAKFITGIVLPVDGGQSAKIG